MNKLAIGIVLLPPKEIMAKAIEINQKLLKETKSDLVLDAQNCLPHITLAMGIAKENELPRIYELITDVAKRSHSLPLTITETEVLKHHKGAMSAFNIERTKELQDLHNTVLEKIVPLFSYESETSMFFQPPVITEPSSWWKNRMPEEMIRENYHPHITLGHGEASPLNEPISFIASRIAVCHLGKNSTCRRILFEKRIN